MKQGKPILLVEDDVVDIMSVKRALRDLNIQNPFFHKNNGEDALEFLRNADSPRPAIILLDLNMPRMNGIEFLKHIKQDEKLRRIPVIILTTSAAEPEKVQSFDLGVSGYMIKPVDYMDFLNVMRTISSYWMTSELPG
jgi:CheY-like chemotaxis protein